jgi:hypothetical protein
VTANRARNLPRVNELRQLAHARRESHRTKQAARRFKILEDWETRDSWSLPRRLIAKAEWTQGEANPHFLVTSLNWTDDARYLYEGLYCARGDMENRIKECQTDMFAGRTSAASMRPNQLRLCLCMHFTANRCWAHLRLAPVFRETPSRGSIRSWSSPGAPG